MLTTNTCYGWCQRCHLQRHLALKFSVRPYQNKGLKDTKLLCYATFSSLFWFTALGITVLGLTRLKNVTLNTSNNTTILMCSFDSVKQCVLIFHLTRTNSGGEQVAIKACDCYKSDNDIISSCNSSTGQLSWHVSTRTYPRKSLMYTQKKHQPQ